MHRFRSEAGEDACAPREKPEAILYVSEFMIRRCICLTLQPRRTNSVASQSRSSGCDGLTPIFPKLLGVGTMPRPKCQCQIRLTMTRAVSGLSADAIHSANARRRPLLTPLRGEWVIGGGEVASTNTCR